MHAGALQHPRPESGRGRDAAGLRPGGRVLLLEHVRSPGLVVRTIQRALEPITVRLEGDHLVREPLDFLTTARFDIEEVERSKLGIVERVAARKPAGVERTTR